MSTHHPQSEPAMSQPPHTLEATGGAFHQPAPAQQPGVPPAGSYTAEHPARPHVGFGTAIKAFFANYATFKGRASRSEFWWAFVFQAVVASFLYVLFVIGVLLIQKETIDLGGGSTYTTSKGLFSSPLGTVAMFALLLWFLATIVPSLALQVRRLHDTDKPGWFVLLNLIPGIGGILVLILYAANSQPSGVRFDDAAGRQPTPVPAQAPGATPYQG